jgi:hypothetical protein
VPASKWVAMARATRHISGSILSWPRNLTPSRESQAGQLDHGGRDMMITDKRTRVTSTRIIRIIQMD